MKKILCLFSLLFSVGTPGVFAAEGASGALLEHQLHVYFAPPSRQGVYRLQVLKDGSVTKVDNHGDSKVLMTFSPEVMVRLEKRVASLGEVTLKEPEGGHCFDAPLEKILAQGDSSEPVLISKTEGCLTWTTTDRAANELTTVVRGLLQLAKQLDSVRE